MRPQLGAMPSGIPDSNTRGGVINVSAVDMNTTFPRDPNSGSGETSGTVTPLAETGGLSDFEAALRNAEDVSLGTSQAISELTSDKGTDRGELELSLARLEGLLIDDDEDNEEFIDDLSWDTRADHDMVSGKLLNNFATMMWPCYEERIDGSPQESASNTPGGSPRASNTTEVRKVTGKSKMEAERVKKELIQAQKAFTDGQGRLEYSLPRNPIDYSLPPIGPSTDNSLDRGPQSPVRQPLGRVMTDAERVEYEHQLSLTAAERDDALEELARLRGLNFWRGRDHSQIRADLVNATYVPQTEEEQQTMVTATKELTEEDRATADWRRKALMEELAPLDLVTVRRATTLSDDENVIAQWAVYKRYHTLVGRWLASWRERAQLWNLVVREVVVHWKRVSEFTALRTWRAECGWEQARIRAMQEAMLSEYRCIVGDAMRQWMRQATAWNMFNQAIRAAAMVWADSWQYTSFFKWKTITAEWVLRREAIDRAIELYNHQQCLDALILWQQLARNWREEQRMYRDAHSSILISMCQRAFRTWSHETEQLIAAKAVMLLAINNWQHARLYQAWDKLYQNLEQPTLVKPELYWAMRRLSRSTAKWRAAAEAWRVLRDKLRSAAIRLGFFGMKPADAWLLWRDGVAAVRARLQLMQRAISRWAHRELSRAMQKWIEWRQQCLEVQKLALWAAKHWLRGELSRGWGSWRSWYAECQRIAFMVGGVIRRMMNRLLSRAWEQWQFMAAEARRQAMLVRRGLMRMMKAKLAAALYTWRDQAAMFKRLAFIGGGVLNRMRNMLLSRAWEQWQWVAVEMKRQRFLMNGAITRMRNRLLSRAWEQWQFVAAEAKRVAYMLSGAIRRMMNRLLSQAWEQCSRRVR